ncbi:hypothetical protein HJ107_23310 [Vibrio parahaemolyticus]|nr:hypothetical protein [Vibrio parahaemolyticus]EKH9200316.1 hypothetical protein [Vibrio parahaemolyticus]MBE4089719.1 hypothetical protein [Vibrio parahaemolyticus]MCQ9091980.1 hypothetical protein [Vibrio parahaemolyticus]TOE39700.1 hypothetical protein CGJ45_15770 [Vibrio parahaemolyticus]TOL21761.1 hypothetical protein CGI04_06880 [Vibrio parahaemolyticus]
MRNISISIPQRAERVADVSPVKQARDDGKFKRVRDVKHIEKRQRKYPRIFRVRRKAMTPQNQRQFVKLLNSYQLRALRDWHGFSESLPDESSLNDAQVFILQTVQQSPHLYPVSVKKILGKYSNQLVKTNDGNEPSSETLQQLVAYDHYLEGLLSLLVLCRRYDQADKKHQAATMTIRKANDD